MSTTCTTCLALNTCEDDDDFTRYNLQTNAFYSPSYALLAQCPPGYNCLQGLFPSLFRYPAGQFVITMPTPGSGGLSLEDFYMNLQGCQSMLFNTIPAGSTQAVLTAAATAMALEAVQQQLICDAISNSPPGTVVPK